MNLVLIIILISIVVVGLIVVSYIFNYNKIQGIHIKINESESIIDNELRKKYDLILKTKKTINKLLKKEVTYFKELEEIKFDNVSNFDIDRKIIEGETLIHQVKNDFRSLEDNEEYLTVLKELKERNEMLEAAKSFYNKYTTEINMLIKKFPTNLIAKIHKIKLRSYFDGKNMFDEEIKDFKL